MRAIPLLVWATLAFAADPTLTPEMHTLVDHISATSLRTNLTYIASDQLEGRATPSPGLDLAAAYIAAQFKQAGLEPAGDDQYFQTATLSLREPNWDGFEMTVTVGGNTLHVDRTSVYILAPASLKLDDIPFLAVDSNTELTPERVNGAALYLADPRAGNRLRAFQPAIVFTAARGLSPRPTVSDAESARATQTTAIIANPDVAKMLTPGVVARLTLHMSAPLEHTAKVRNVAGLLRGSDPVLRDTYVLLTAHYDHLGTRATGDDRIYNGANDDGSGTVSVVEIASALGALHPRPKRSILFVTFFGEELGLLGSRYYGRHPLVPLDKTIADLNMEQIGRTDASDGPQIANATLNGFDFSELPREVADAGKLVGIKVYKNEQFSDPYFGRSDNQALADIGIPAHTVAVSFEFPDYHAVTDTADKIDYDNMAKVDSAVALALFHLASEAPPPKWNETNPAAKRYLDAAKKLHP